MDDRPSQSERQSTSERAEWSDEAVPIMDSPALRAELRGQLQRLRSVESSVQSFIQSVQDLTTSFSQHSALDAGGMTQLLNSSEMAQLNVKDTFTQLSDFADNLQHQLQRSVLEPLREYHATIGVAIKSAKTFDEESEALDTAHHKYLSLSRDSPVETRVYAHGELCDRAAGVNLSLFDARTALREGCAAERFVPQRALSELLVAQLAYHQSCTRLLTSIMPQVGSLLQRTDSSKSALDEARAADKLQREVMPRPQLREGATLAEGWLYKGTFNLASGDTQAQLSRLKPWNKRWFVLCDDGKLYYYKAPEDAKQAKVPIDMNLLSSVSAVNGPLEFELKVGKRTLRLKAAETAERERWMGRLQAYLDNHEAERQAAINANQRRYQQAGTGVRDVDQKMATHHKTALEGYLYRQDTDMMRRWRKWWCVVGDGELTCSLYDSLKLTDGLGKVGDKLGRSSAASALLPERSGGPSVSSTSTATSTKPLAPAAVDGIEAVPSRVVQSAVLPLATVTVREARQFSLPYVFEVISPQLTITLQAQSQSEMAMWIEVIQNATASSLGVAIRTTRINSNSLVGTTWGEIRQTEGNDSCSDCGALHPSWSSINLGAVVCLACAGVHRQMGVHISKVRSLELDTKEWSVSLVRLMAALGNAALNAIWQPHLTETPLAGAAATSSQREAHIRRKYEARDFLSADACPSPPAVHVAAVKDDVILMAACLAHKLDVDMAALPQPSTSGGWAAEAAEVHAGRTPLHIAAASGSETVLELLLQNLAVSSVGVDSGDPRGKSALKLAVEAGEAGCVNQLLTRGANISFADSANQTPMQAAAELGHDSISEAMLSYKLAQDEKLLRQIDVE